MISRILLIFCLSLCSFSGAISAQGENLSISTDDTPKAPVPGSFAALSARLMPAVVNIQTRKTIDLGFDGFAENSPLNEFNDFFNRDNGGARRQSGLGSGFFISADGYIVTNHHVIDGADQIEIVMSDGRRFDANLVGTDAETDIAVLHLNHTEPFSYVSFGQSDAINVGDWVIAIGNPFGFGGTVTTGIVSARNRDINAGRFDDFIQTDAAINQGNSGGPLFNLKGEVIGVNTAIISNTGGSIGLGFAVPSRLAQRIAAALLEDGSVERAWLGARAQTASTELVAAFGGNANSAIVLNAIIEDGPAANAGLQIGDLILRFNGETLRSARAFVALVADSPIGEPLDIELTRDGRPMTISVVLEQAPSDASITSDSGTQNDAPLAAQNFADLGLELTNITDADRRRYTIPKDVKGIIVRAIMENGPAFGKLRRGDVITEIGFDVVFDMKDGQETLTQKLDEARARDRPLLLRINRRGLPIFVPISLD